MTWIDKNEIIIGERGENLASVTGLKELQVNAMNHWITSATIYASAQTNSTLLTPASGRKLVMHSLFISTDSVNQDIDIQSGSGTQLFYLYTRKEQSALQVECNKELATDDSVVITCGEDTFVCATYHEEI